MTEPAPCEASIPPPALNVGKMGRVNEDDRPDAESSITRLLDSRLRSPRDVTEGELATLIARGTNLRRRGSELASAHDWVEPWKFTTWRQDLDRWIAEVTHALAKAFTSDAIARDFARLAALDERPFPTSFDALLSFGASLSSGLNTLVSTYERLDLFDEETPTSTLTSDALPASGGSLPHVAKNSWRRWSWLQRVGAVAGGFLAAAASVAAIMTFFFKPPWRDQDNPKADESRRPPGFVTATPPRSSPKTVTTPNLETLPLPKGAWPARPTFNWDRPATYVTLNSITDNPQVGDERAFLRAAFSLRNAAEAAYKRTLLVERGETIYLRIFYDNDAAPNLNLVATNVRVRILIPSQSRRQIIIASYITANNAKPNMIMDVVSLVAAHPINVSYIEDTARLWNSYVQGLRLANSITSSSGALIGGAYANGRINSASGSQGWVSLRLRVHA